MNPPSAETLNPEPITLGNSFFLFKEEGPGYRGKRLYLSKVREEQNTEPLESLRRRTSAQDSCEDRFLVIFKVDKELPLVGDGK